MKISEESGRALALVTTILVALALHDYAAAQEPPVPTFTVTTYDSNAVAPGYVFLAVAVPVTNGGYYAMILKNDGTPVWSKHLEDEAYDFKVLPNGYLHYAEFIHPHSWVGGGDAVHDILDENLNLKESITPGNGYVAESHEFQMLPNGNVLLQAYYRTQMDMSRVVAGGYPNALISGTTIQELDAQRNVVWQWRTWDHFTLADYLPALAPETLKQAVINAFHLNTLRRDDDGNLLVSNYSVDAWKINRQTGDIMWRIGGPFNQFSFVGVDPKEALGHFACHDFHRIENGNVLLYCNGDRLGTRSSKIYEYHLDEVNKVATLVWQYTPSKPVYAWHRGNAQRLPNGNTMIGWGGVTGPQGAACTEVTPAGKVVFEMKFNDPTLESYRAYRFVYPPAAQAQQASVFEVATGNEYVFGNTGVKLAIDSGGGGYNTLTVTREPYAPLYPLFNGKAPQLLPLRVRITESALTALQGSIEFDSSSFGFSNGTNLTVYYRPQAGQGLFIAQPTEYNPATQALRAGISVFAQGGEFGEFAIGYPEVTEVPFPPILNQVESYRGIQPYEVIAPLSAAWGSTNEVNQELPVALSWSPKGFAGWYRLQIATNQDFSKPLVDVPYQTQAFFVWTNPAPDALCYYRVRTSNSGGVGDWSTGTFRTVPPTLELAFPSSADAVRRGLTYFIRWTDNLNENVAIELYKGSALALTITTNAPSTGAYRWQVPASLPVGSDYTLRIRSTVDPELSATSDSGISIIDAPTIQPDGLVRTADGQVRLTINVPGADGVTVLGSSDLSAWDVLQTVPLTNGTAVFTDTGATNLASRYYRLRVP